MLQGGGASSSDTGFKVGSQDASSASVNVGGQALLATQQEKGLCRFWGKPKGAQPVFRTPCQQKRRAAKCTGSV